MQDHLLGHLLGALDPSEHEEVEARLQTDAALRAQHEALRRSLRLLEEDREPFEPPAGLAARACESVAACVAAAARASEAAAPTPRFGLHDLLVAGGIAAAALLLFFPALSQSRHVARRAGCENNLRAVGVALTQFSDHASGRFPQVPVSGRLASAGIYALELMEGGYLTDPRAFLCPGCPLSSLEAFRVPSRGELLAANDAERREALARLGGSYGYTLGHQREGRYLPTRNSNRFHFALLADGSCPQQVSRESRNHGCGGQNVLFEDQHVEYVCGCTVRQLGHDDNVYFNDEGLVAPGLHSDDAVIHQGLVAGD